MELKVGEWPVEGIARRLLSRHLSLVGRDSGTPRSLPGGLKNANRLVAMTTLVLRDANNIVRGPKVNANFSVRTQAPSQGLVLSTEDGLMARYSSLLLRSEPARMVVLPCRRCSQREWKGLHLSEGAQENKAIEESCELLERLGKSVVLEEVDEDGTQNTGRQVSLQKRNLFLGNWEKHGRASSLWERSRRSPEENKEMNRLKKELPL
ncbi:uncharacterized protein LOC122728694 [Dromiciops gliroides]|uniref:uncharacterized protein LOC122728694 n=1 Tax=Dromiciops gliroides TaxID=33562 RepID=UPI001CC4E65E|nr:uncharacterized protein LOC122728694 [Dromiciops gliroides]